MSSVDLYSAHAETIESALAFACRSHRLRADVADEFCSWARLRFLDNDQVILRRFEGRSSARTFLITVVQRLFLDWRNAEWGKWRPSSSARRLGPVAIELERLVLRDRLAYHEAVEMLTSSAVASPRECDDVWAKLPRRPRRQRVDEDGLTVVASTASASELVDDDASRLAAARLGEGLDRALEALPPSDRVLLRLRYWEGVTVARIATMTGEDQKALYRRFAKLTADLRRQLEAEGITGQLLADLDDRFAQFHDSDRRGQADGDSGIPQMRPSPLTSTGGEHV